MWLSKKGVLIIEIIPLIRPTLGYEFPGMLKAKPSVKPLQSSEASLIGPKEHGLRSKGTGMVYKRHDLTPEGLYKLGLLPVG